MHAVNELHTMSTGLPQLEEPPGGLATGNLPPSVVEVQQQQRQRQQQQQMAAAGAAVAASDSGEGPAVSSSSSSSSSLLLVSSGWGDLSLVSRPCVPTTTTTTAAAAATLLSAPVLPLRPAPPLQGARPVHLAAAFELPGGFGGGDSDDDGVRLGEQQQQQQQAGRRRRQICCILWAARPRSGRQASRCEVYAVRLALLPSASLEVLQVQLLKVSAADCQQLAASATRHHI